MLTLARRWTRSQVAVEAFFESGGEADEGASVRAQADDSDDDDYDADDDNHDDDIDVDVQGSSGVGGVSARPSAPAPVPAPAPAQRTMAGTVRAVAIRRTNHNPTLAHVRPSLRARGD